MKHRAYLLNDCRMFGRPSVVATLNTVYGISTFRAKRLNCFMLNHPVRNRFRNKYDPLTQYHKKGLFFRIFNALALDRKLRFFSYMQIRRKCLIGHYHSYRLFQNLPQKGQRTRANAKSPKNYNPFTTLGFAPEAFLKQMRFVYKRKELQLNLREKQLKELQQNAQSEKAKEKAERKAKTKSKVQSIIREAKLANRAIKK